ncbi:hypothetical protein [Actinoplanes sp. NPDC051494]|uniref:hypothetical protein n=1 Tax=Actinoplanes sp. NPDC051494 TaxID=3363907 RepID=UPI0037B5ED53
MSDVKLSLPERALLLILMAENVELSNPQIGERFAPGLKLTGAGRLKLDDAKLIESRKGERGAYFFTITAQGRDWCREEFGGVVPTGAGSAGQALYAVLHGLGRYLDRTGLDLVNVYGDRPTAVEPVPVADEPPTGQPGSGQPGSGQPGSGQPGSGQPGAAATIPADEIAVRIRRAYRKLADPAGAWIGLATLRDHLGEVPSADLDGVLRLMARMPGVRIEEETNQKALSDRDRAAAVTIGAREQHLLAIESR